MNGIPQENAEMEIWLKYSLPMRTGRLCFLPFWNGLGYVLKN